MNSHPKNCVLLSFPKYLNHTRFCGSANSQPCHPLQICWSRESIPALGHRWPFSLLVFFFFIAIFFPFKCFKSLQTIFSDSPCPTLKDPIVHFKTSNPSPLTLPLSTATHGLLHCVFGAQNNIRISEICDSLHNAYNYVQLWKYNVCPYCVLAANSPTLISKK